MEINDESTFGVLCIATTLHRMIFLNIIYSFLQTAISLEEVQKDLFKNICYYDKVQFYFTQNSVGRLRKKI